MEDVAALHQPPQPPTTPSTPYDLCFGVFASRVEINGSAAGGTATALDRTISLAETFSPYTRRLSPLSGRIVEPSRERPANRPGALDELKISARRVASVSADASRPTGPAAMEASAPSFTLLDRMPLAPLSFITSNTKSVACPQI